METVRLPGFIREGSNVGRDVDQAERVADLVGQGDRQLLAGEIVIDEDLAVGRVVEAVDRRGGVLEMNRRAWGRRRGPRSRP